MCLLIDYPINICFVVPHLSLPTLFPYTHTHTHTGFPPPPELLMISYICPSPLLLKTSVNIQ